MVRYPLTPPPLDMEKDLRTLQYTGVLHHEWRYYLRLCRKVLMEYFDRERPAQTSEPSLRKVTAESSVIAPRDGCITNSLDCCRLCI